MKSIKVPEAWNSKIQSKFAILIEDIKTYNDNMFGYLDLLEEFAELWENHWAELREDCEKTNNVEFFKSVEQFYDDRVTILNIMDDLIDL